MTAIGNEIGIPANGSGLLMRLLSFPTGGSQLNFPESYGPIVECFMPEKKLPSWAVAAAFLVLEKDSLHYKTLAAYVLGTELTDLAQRGGSDPANTLRTVLGNQHPELFTFVGAGEYAVTSCKALDEPEVRAALAWIIQHESQEVQSAVELLLSEPVSKFQPKGFQRVDLFQQRIQRLCTRIRECGGW